MRKVRISLLAVGNDELVVSHNELGVGEGEVAPFGRCRGRGMRRGAWETARSRRSDDADRRDSGGGMRKSRGRPDTCQKAWESHARDEARAKGLGEVTGGTGHVREGFGSHADGPKREGSTCKLLETPGNPWKSLGAREIRNA